MVKIDREKCVGCGACANVCPDGIEMEDGKAKIKNENADCLNDAINVCPIRCIISEKNELEESNNFSTRPPNKESRFSELSYEETAFFR